MCLNLHHRFAGLTSQTNRLNGHLKCRPNYDYVTVVNPLIQLCYWMVTVSWSQLSNVPSSPAFHGEYQWRGKLASYVRSISFISAGCWDGQKRGCNHRVVCQRHVQSKNLNTSYCAKTKLKGCTCAMASIKTYKKYKNQYQEHSTPKTISSQKKLTSAFAKHQSRIDGKVFLHTDLSEKCNDLFEENDPFWTLLCKGVPCTAMASTCFNSSGSGRPKQVTRRLTDWWTTPLKQDG